MLLWSMFKLNELMDIATNLNLDPRPVYETKEIPGIR